MNQEASKYVWMAKEKEYLSGRLHFVALLGISLIAPLDCEVILMTLLLIVLVDPFLGKINIWSGINDTEEGRDSATLSEK